MEKTLIDYWFTLYKRRYVIGLIILSSLATTIVISLLLPPVYEAKAVFFVPQRPSSSTFLASPEGSSIAKTTLIPDPKEDSNAPYLGILKSKALAELVKAEYPDKSVDDLKRRDTNYVLTNEYLIEVYARDEHAADAAGIANAYVRNFNRTMQGISDNYRLSSIRQSLEQQIAAADNDLAGAREKLKNFQAANETASIDEETKQFILMRMNAKNKLDANKVSMSENDMKIRSVLDQLNKESRLISSKEFTVTSPALESIQRSISDVKVKMAGLGADIKPTHPDYVSLKRQYDQLEDLLGQEVNRIVNSQIKSSNSFYESLRQRLVNLYVEKETLLAERNAYASISKLISRDIRNIPRIKDTSDQLASDVARINKSMDVLKSNLREAKAQEGKEMVSGVIVEHANPPANPAFPVLWLNGLVGIMVGFIAGVLYAFFLEHLEMTRKIRYLDTFKVLLEKENA